MSCYHPLKGFVVGTTENGKKKLKVVSYDVDYIPNSNWKPNSNEPFGYDEFVPIPCGQCIGCRLDYSKQWATRCMLEAKYHEDNYFLTLTYDDENVIHTGYYDENGDFSDTLTLHKKDLQDFNKRLRRALEYRGKDSFRFYACGEYGSVSARPHYHMIAFGLKLDDLVLYKKSPAGNLYNSPFLDKIWKKGHVVIGSVTYESCAYVSRYIMKKQKGKNADVYDKYNISPEFVVMSRNPGIAKEYFNDNYQTIYDTDSIVLDGGKLVHPPRYFDVLMSDIDEELMDSVKLKRSDIAEKLQEYKNANTTADYLMMLEHEENNKESQLKRLVRPLAD